MTQKDVIQIRNYVRGAYPQLKDNSESTDAVWFDMLNEYSYYGILASVKTYIKLGNSFPPTLADIIKGYEIVLDKYQDEILHKMIENGYFDDPEGADPEIADWNKTNRIDKTKYFMSLDKQQWPSWLLAEYKKYLRNIIQIEFGGNNDAKRINRTENVNQERLA